MENQEQDTVVITQSTINNEAMLLQEKAQLDVQIMTAKASPRNIKRALENSIFTATLDIETASTCGYALPRGGKLINGPSVHLAKIIAQNWGNMRLETKVVEISEKTVTSQGIAFDLENNLAIKVEVKRSIMTKAGRMNDDMITVTGNAANAIALRNAIFSIIPKAITDKVYNASKQAITGDISDNTKFMKKRKQVFDGFKDTYSLQEKEILVAIGKNSIDHITADDLIVLIGIAQALKDGDTTVEQAFSLDMVKRKKEELKNKKVAAETPSQQTSATEKPEEHKSENNASDNENNDAGNGTLFDAKQELP